MKKSVLWSIPIAALFCFAQIAVSAELSDKEKLGKFMYEDVNFSFNGTQSCQSCHHPDAGFADPTNTEDPYYTVVSTGANGTSLGGRNAPTSSYCGFSPILHYDTNRGEYVGGMFWDGRATGETLRDPLAEQAQGPPLNPDEMGMASVEDVVKVVQNSEDYVDLFSNVYAKDILKLDPLDVYDLIADAIAAYERSSEVQRFSSRYDTGALTAAEQNGLELFKNHCNKCHHIQHSIGHGETVDVFTSYSYANIGIPANPAVPLTEPDLGLGLTINSHKQRGKFKIPTMRNVAVTPPYGHNGYFPTLESIVTFKNKRPDMEIYPPEVDENISEFIGDMGMTDEEMADLIQFLHALTDL